MARMKNASSSGSTASRKPKPAKNASARKKQSSAPLTVDEYVAAIPEASRACFNRLRAAVRSAMPEDAAQIISYQILAFKLNNRVLVWCGAFAHHCSLFPGASILHQFKPELAGYSTSKGTVHFSSDKPLPVALVKKLVKARVAESKGK
jgi:uncharacterized protein YdhG (YjbR/CyaY superfamily)